MLFFEAIQQYKIHKNQQYYNNTAEILQKYA